MAVFVKGDPVENAAAYKLYEKTDEGYTLLAEESEINFEVSALGLAAGDHVLVVRAKAANYDDSDDSNEVVYNVPVSIDSAVTSFVTAAAIVDPTMITKLNTMVLALKANNLWDKIDALYPCVGSTFDQMSYNLKDTSAYRLTTTGTPEVTENVGFTCSAPVNSDTYATAPGTDFHAVGYAGVGYSSTDQGLLCPGPSHNNGMDDGVLFLSMNGSMQIRTSQTTNRWKVTTSENGSGLYVASLSSGIVYNGQNMNAEQQGTASWTKIAGSPKVFTYNGYANYVSDTGKLNGNCPCRLAGFGKGMTIEEMQTYSEILNTFKGIY